MNADERYWALQIQDIISGLIDNIEKLDKSISVIENEYKILSEKMEDFDAIKFDANLIKDIVDREVNRE